MLPGDSAVANPAARQNQDVLATRDAAGQRPAAPRHGHYGDDLAHIHDAGFGDVAWRAADVLVTRLRSNRIHAGLVTDLGCGSGILAAALTEAGYDVLGVDLSASMLAMAADRAPQASFTRASLFTVDIPACVAVTAIGECLNYDFSAEASLDALGRVFARVARCLPSHGVFLFDVAGPGRGGGDQPRESARVGTDWAVFARASEDASGERLVRDITAFRQVGEGYRRSEEGHTLRLYRPEDVRAQLTAAGLRAEPLVGYGPVPFPAGLHGFLAEPA